MAMGGQSTKDTIKNKHLFHDQRLIVGNPLHLKKFLRVKFDTTKMILKGAKFD